MSKFHINKHGIPASCKATKGNCPYGGLDRHLKGYYKIFQDSGIVH